MPVGSLHVIVQGIALLGAAAATAAFLPGLTAGGLLARLDPTLLADLRALLLRGPLPWLWDATLVLLSTPMWTLPAAAGTLALVLAMIRPPRKTVSWARRLGRRDATIAPRSPRH